MQWQTLLFVYGTLKAGYANAHYLRDAGLLGHYQSRHPFPLVIEQPRFVPCMYELPGQGFQVHGELYVVDDSMLRHIDLLESVNEPDGYYRREIDLVSLEGRRERRAWTYFKRGASRELAAGEFLQCYQDRRYLADD